MTTTPVAERFWPKVDRRGEDECWPWTAALDAHGYGALNNWAERRVLKAHRISYELANGPIPDGLFVCHRCDNPPCVNPGHLFLGTRDDNSADMVAKGRSGSRPNRTPEHVRDRIRAAWAAGQNFKDIGRAVGVSGTTVKKILTQSGAL